MTGFFKEAYSELIRVSWPTREQTIRLTRYVIGVSLVVGLYVAVLDFIFKLGVEKLVIK